VALHNLFNNSILTLITMLLVTGATGGLGHETIDCLLTTTPTTEIAALVRDVSKATDLVQRGVEVRQADYHEQRHPGLWHLCGPRRADIK
jgi:nucleoside-diphosphate-sugar epimerase